MKISASIYSDKKRPLKEVIEDLVAHQVDLLHVDCNDDLSVFDDIRKIRQWCTLPIDLHIISKTPEKYFDLLRDCPVDYVAFQYEDLPSDFTLPADIPGEKGLAIVTPTPVEVFYHHEEYDFLLLMATVPGQSGGIFDPENFRKIRNFKAKYPKKKVHVDGGVNGEVSFILRNMGIHASVSGSFLFKAASIGHALMDLTKREIESQFVIKDFMTPREECPILHINELSLHSALQVIEDGKLGFCIVEENASTFKGIISNADVRKALLRNIQNIPALDPKEMININPVSINENATVNELLQLVREQAIPIIYLPVVNEKGNATGILTFVNLIKGEI